jgi:hypothetical protein
MVSVHLCVFNEFSLQNALFHLGDRAKVIMDAIFLSLSWVARCMRHAKSKLSIWESVHEHLDQRSLSYATGSSKDYWFGQDLLEMRVPFLHLRNQFGKGFR